MADTIVSNSPGSTNDSSGWAVAVIILLVVIAGGFFMLRYGFAQDGGKASDSAASVNVTLPVTPAPYSETPKQ